MSKLAKILKDVHLGSLPGFARSTANQPAASVAEADPKLTSLAPDGDETCSRASSNGILVVTIHEARGLTLPDGYITAQSRTTSTRGVRASAKNLPYAVVDFDKLQAFVNAVEGNTQNPLWAGSNTQYKFDVSRVSDVIIHLLIRNPDASVGAGRAHDISLGSVRLTPKFEVEKSAIPSPGGEEAAHAHGLSHVRWLDVQNGTGQLQIGVRFVENRVQKLSVKDFELLKVIGRGSFGKVTQVRKKDTKRIYALKSIQKAKIISQSEVTHTLAERSVLAQINNPFIVPLKFSFQSPEKLYFVLAFVNGGELFQHLTNERRFNINRARLYTAELLCALECLHGFNVVYRDLKPENILLDSQGHIALCDFGLCKLKLKDEDYTNTFCGTPEYLAPELVLGKAYNKTVDWWTLGVLLYEMITGLPPFYDQDTNEMYRKIASQPLTFPGSHIVPPPVKDLLTKLLNRIPEERLGANGSAEIKSHPFFDGIDWRKLLERKYEPEFKPNVSSIFDTRHIDPIWKGECPKDSPVDDPALSPTMQLQFDGFSYNQPVAGLSDAGGSIVDPSFMNDSERQR